MVSLKLSEIVEVAASRPSPGLVPCVLKAAPAQLSPGLLMPPKLLGEEVGSLPVRSGGSTGGRGHTTHFMSLWHVQLSDCVAWGWKVPGSNPSSAIYWLRDPGE